MTLPEINLDKENVMPTCEHKSFRMEPRRVKGPGGEEDIIILFCEQCYAIADHFDPSFFDEKTIDQERIVRQYSQVNSSHQVHALRNEIKNLKIEKERLEKALELAEAKIQNMNKNAAPVTSTKAIKKGIDLAIKAKSHPA